MAETTIRIQRWDNGVLVEDYAVAKPPEQWAEETLFERAAAALTVNKTFIGTPNGDLTNALVAAEVKALARQNNALIRMLLRRLDDVSDTE